MIGTAATANMYFGAIFNKIAINCMKFPKPVVLVCSLPMNAGLSLASICQKVTLINSFLTQGLLFGLDASFTYISPVTCVPPFFTLHLVVASLWGYYSQAQVWV
jgi:hypothetical protein